MISPLFGWKPKFPAFFDGTLMAQFVEYPSNAIFGYSFFGSDFGGFLTFDSITQGVEDRWRNRTARRPRCCLVGPRGENSCLFSDNGRLCRNVQNAHNAGAKFLSSHPSTIG